MKMCTKKQSKQKEVRQESFDKRRFSPTEEEKENNVDRNDVDNVDDVEEKEIDNLKKRVKDLNTQNEITIGNILDSLRNKMNIWR